MIEAKEQENSMRTDMVIAGVAFCLLASGMTVANAQQRLVDGAIDQALSVNDLENWPVQTDTGSFPIYIIVGDGAVLPFNGSAFIIDRRKPDPSVIHHRQQETGNKKYPIPGRFYRNGNRLMPY